MRKMLIKKKIIDNFTKILSEAPSGINIRKMESTLLNKQCNVGK
jgi:hypothetical protein